ncbi:ZF-HD protein dimerization region containing protein [Iris pallida]|uniref:ZF-HD protein dimerization region containing protein n=1 Tax=Iris pallida TaxID=29817 RepID=A0AAX6H3J1_IRIPA|nr:ZF-HD protein dimerization region containing protein [Iris pallida]
MMDFDEHDDLEEEEVGLPPGQTRKVTVPGSSSSGGGGRYRECLKNHAVGIGGDAIDGCGEFMPAGEKGTLDALRYAVCSCHRNFHHKELPDGSPAGPTAAERGYHHQFSPYYRTPTGYLHHHHHHQMAVARTPPPLALPSTSVGHSRDEEELSDPMATAGAGGAASASGSGKKRFRTKFTQEQKEKLLAFAELVGWRIQKHDEAAVQQFCYETMVKRHVLKVWMHNNKHTLGRKTLARSLSPPPPSG